MILYEGPSELDGSPIVAIGTSGSKNQKTGDMIQVWILSKNQDPIEANRTGNDFSICGNCPLKGTPNKNKKGTASKRSCYVLLQNAPLAVWKKYKAGGYKKAKSLVKFGTGQAIRLGAYGDPAALPARVIKDLTRNASTWTGYTHQIENISEDSKKLMMDTLMISCETLEQAQKAWTNGGRTFRMISDKSKISENEIFCPATPEGGSRTNCKFCGLCKGRALKAKSIAVLAHGAGKKNSLQVIQ